MNGAETRGVDASFISGSAAASVSHMDLAADLNDPKKVRALFTWNNNIVASSPGTKAIRKGLLREDLFTVVTDLFMTDTAVYADYVLPAASFLEFDDLIFPAISTTRYAQAKAAEPPASPCRNSRSSAGLAKAIGLNEGAPSRANASMIISRRETLELKENSQDLERWALEGFSPAPVHRG